MDRVPAPVYGIEQESELSTLRFPVHLGNFMLFYASALSQQLLSNLLVTAPRNSSKQWVGLRKGMFLMSIDSWFAPPVNRNGEPTIKLLWRYIYPSSGCLRGTWPHKTADGKDRVLPPPPFAFDRGFPNNTLVEIWHATPPPAIVRPHRQTGGVWMYLAVGSGVWHDIGRTAVFVDHQHAAAHFGLAVHDMHNFRKLGIVARASGLDTLQFTHRYMPRT